ncbi:phenylalanine--tRNA ligase subunit beta [Candidatus Gracilibacteria bacterium GN02-872]|nr:phenylalanine--tRNA ligase subunit beta [Candidatus Gracilibacteria bacterium GN02-872]
MKISYKALKRQIPDLKSVEEVAKDLVMHTAEVEEIDYEGENLEKVFIGIVKTCEKHPDSEKLNCTTVEVLGQTYPIVCGAPNVKAGIKVPVALVGAKLKADFIIAKTKIRGETSEGMICSEDELGLVDERQAGIMELSEEAPLGACMRDYLEKNDAIIEVDNKAINHRPDLFSHIGILREIQAINGKKFDFEYENIDLSSLPDLNIKNEIPNEVSRYIGVKMENVENSDSPDYIKEVLNSAGVKPKGLLVDLSNYSLYFYGQPTHIFDADKIDGDIIIRKAKSGEKFLTLNDTEYKLDENDIVIADNSKILALGGIIGGKESAVSDSTKNIIIESAHFDQAIIRITGKKLGIRTDALNVFEKDILNEMQDKGASLIISEILKNIPNAKLISFSDIYPKKQEKIFIDFDLDFINNLIGKKYEKTEILDILNNLGIKLVGDKLEIPFWRKDLTYKADIAEEIARISGYDSIKPTIPSINLGAVTQSNTYKIKNSVRDFLTSIGYFDLYTYSFVNKELVEKCGLSTENLVEMKNALSEELTHLRGSLIPNLLMTVENNNRDFKDLKLFEIEKVFEKKGNDVLERYFLSGVEVIDKDLVYFDIQKTVSKLLKYLGVEKYFFEKADKVPDFAHTGRTAVILVRGQEIGFVGEIHPKVAKNFEISERIGFFEIDVEKLKEMVFGKIKTKDISMFQENNFDLNFVVEKDKVSASKVKATIEKAEPKLITKVELIDIYENNLVLAGKRSLTFRIYIQSMDGTLDDKAKTEIIEKIIAAVKKIGGELR